MSDQFFDFYEPVFQEQKISDTVFTAIDFETTGLYPSEDRITEVGIVKFNLDKELDSYSSLINPQRHIPSESVKISGINDEMVSDAPLFSHIYPDITAFLEGSLIIAHNINFDYSFLKMEAALMNEEYKLEIGVDTVSLARKTLKGHQRYSLQNLAKDLGFDVKNAHRALDDARICMRIFLKAVSGIENFREMSVKEFFLYSNTRLK